MSNPLYEILPRGDWLRASGICQRDADFVFDPLSRSRCCPTPNYCCPNSVIDCSDPHAVRFNAASSGGALASAITDAWPRRQHPPYRWSVTPATRDLMAGLWRNRSESLWARARGFAGGATSSRVRREADAAAAIDFDMAVAALKRQGG